MGFNYLILANLSCLILKNLNCFSGRAVLVANSSLSMFLTFQVDILVYSR